MKEMVGGCCVCSDERGWPDNPLVYCDGNGCTVAVHQACYGIVTVPTGPWFCRKCESPDKQGRVRCELCPSKSGALKRSDTGGWAHVVCALYIPEVRFGNVTSMEPIVLRLIPPERYNKTCYICQDMGKTHRATAGACMQCNKSGCKQQFHVTCAQSLGLLCEEAGNYLDNVKYCGYCQHHYSKLKKGGNVKTIPPYKPVSQDSQSSDSSGEKEGDASPMASGSGTPTNSGKSKGGGRKSSHSNSSGKNTPNSSKTPTSTSQSMGSKLQHSGDKPKKSPSRRASSTGEVAPASGGSSKTNTPAPSPQHTVMTSEPSPQITQMVKGSSGSTPGGSVRVPSSEPSPGTSKSFQEQPVGVISTVASAAAAIVTPTTPSSTAVTTSVVQTTNSVKPTGGLQESVITNLESVDTKQTKKRKAVSAANTPTTPVDYAAIPPPVLVNDSNLQGSGNMWDNTVHVATDSLADNAAVEKVLKKAKTEPNENIPVTSHFTNLPPLPSGPPPAHSPSSQPGRILATPTAMPGTSNSVTVSNIRSPSQHQVSGNPSETSGLSPHIFHQAQKIASVELPIAAHSPHAVPGRSSWGGLTVSYEMQQPENKSSIGLTIVKDCSTSIGGTAIRNKKRAAMSTSVVAHANPSTSTIQNIPIPTLPPVRRPPQPTPPPIYQETIKDSPPTSPGSERCLKLKTENKIGAACTAPHMLGNELNPESVVAARLQEQLSAELAAHAAGGSALSPLLPPPLINKATQGAIGSSSRTSSSAQSLDQLLERQWEQGSQFLMEQAQHFDIASLLSCLHQLRTENVRLEEHVGSLLQRRDHLLAVNARLAIPLTSVSTGPPEPSRCSRDNGSQIRAPTGSVRTETMNAERPHQMMMREVQQKPS